MRDELKTVLADILELPVDQIGDDAGVETLAEWDSLAHLQVMLAVEHHFGLHLPTEAMAQLTSLESIEAVLP